MNVFLFAALVLAPSPVQEAEPPVATTEPTHFVRLLRDEDARPVALQTAVVRYRAPQGELTVDLIGAVHVGDAAYYGALNERFASYDALLYELVAARGDEVPRPEDDKGPLNTFLSRAGATFFGLSTQLEHIDYTPEHFVHADLSPAEMKAAWEKRGENGLTLALGVFTDLMRQANLEAESTAPAEARAPNLFELVLQPDGMTGIKRALAGELARQAGPGQLGPTLETLLITDRNQAAARVLTREIANGKQRLALFYGAAHLPDFERRLLEEFGLVRDTIEWHTAWDLEKEVPEAGLSELFEVLAEVLFPVVEPGPQPAPDAEALDR